jgi:hypothetical protein
VPPVGGRIQAVSTNSLTVTALHLLSGPLDDEARSALVFAGDLLVFKDAALLGVEVVKHHRPDFKR